MNDIERAVEALRAAADELADVSPNSDVTRSVRREAHRGIWMDALELVDLALARLRRYMVVEGCVYPYGERDLILFSRDANDLPPALLLVERETEETGT